jgi:hypothetical protein
VSQASAGRGGAQPSAHSDRGPASPLAVVVGLAAIGLLLVVLFFRSTPATDLAPEQRALANALVEDLQARGVLIRFSCPEGRAYVTRTLWDRFNAEQKRGLPIGLATACRGERAGYRMAVLDVEGKQLLATFDGSAFTIP